MMIRRAFSGNRGDRDPWRAKEVREKCGRKAIDWAVCIKDSERCQVWSAGCGWKDVGGRVAVVCIGGGNEDLTSSRRSPTATPWHPRHVQAK